MLSLTNKSPFPPIPLPFKRNVLPELENSGMVILTVSKGDGKVNFVPKTASFNEMGNVKIKCVPSMRYN